MGNPTPRPTSLLLLGVLAGCGPGKLPGHYWELDLSTAADNCNSSTVGYSETLEYRLEYGLETVSVSIGSDTFASGYIEGCRVIYESITWTEARRDGDIRWTLSGEAIAQREAGSCGIASDWQGTETFTVVSSEDPDIRPGCTYELNLSGTYIGEVE